jgi:glycosyltransferase involved in cell wall biosynthesis
LPSAEKLARVRDKLALGDAPLHVEPMVHVVPSPRSADEGPPRPPDGPSTILYLGRLTRQKGVDDLIHALAALGEGYCLEIAGDGPERRRLERLVQRMALPVRFHGFVDEDRKASLWAAADVLCVPSRELPGGFSEGAPLVVREAFAHGVPVVATRVGGIPELCTHGGRANLVAPNDPQALAASLAALCSRANPSLRDAG